MIAAAPISYRPEVLRKRTVAHFSAAMKINMFTGNYEVVNGRSVVSGFSEQFRAVPALPVR